MADRKKAQTKAGIPAARRGQETGDEKSPRDEKELAGDQTPALRGRHEGANKFFADDSSQHVGTGSGGPSDNSPSIPAAVPTGTKLGESGGEREFKERQKAQVKRRK